MPLPLATSPEDLSSLVSFLATKPSGASLAEAEAVLGGSATDERKLAMHQLLGVVAREDGRLKLTPAIGRKLARCSEVESQTLLAERLSTVRPYRSVLEWAHHNGCESLSADDVGAHWHDHHRDELGTDNERQINQRAVCFLKFAEAAGLGEFFVGRRGQLTRLEIDSEALRALITSGEFDPDVADDDIYDVEDHDEQGVATEVELERPSKPAEASVGNGIFIGHGKDRKPLEELKKILGEFLVPFKVATDEPNLGRPIGGKVKEIMEQCNCAILIFTADEEFFDKDGNSIWRPSENVVHELGAASFRYGDRIVVLKDERVTLPTNFRELGYIPFDSDQLGAKAMEILKELIGFGIVKVST